MHRFFIEPGHAPGERVELAPEEAAHALRVLRLPVGSEVALLDGAGALFAGELIEAGPRAVARLLEALPGAEPPVRLTLYQGLPKFEKLEFIAQKATELGAAALVPVCMERSVVKLKAQEGEKKRERLGKIAREAAKQCGRARVPAIEAPLSWPEALARMAGHDLLLMPWEEARTGRLREAFARFPGARDIGLLIGPEGGIAPREAEEAVARGALALSLGPRILRAETAALAACAMILQLWGDL